MKRKLHFVLLRECARTYLQLLDILCADGDEIDDGARLWLMDVMRACDEGRTDVDHSLLRFSSEKTIYGEITQGCVYLFRAIERMGVSRESMYRDVRLEMIASFDRLCRHMSEENIHYTMMLLDANVGVEEAYRFIFTMKYNSYNRDLVNVVKHHAIE